MDGKYRTPPSVADMSRRDESISVPAVKEQFWNDRRALALVNPSSAPALYSVRQKFLLAHKL